MPRYITRQRHSTSCGPVAIINALKWLGRKASYNKFLPKLKRLGWKRKTGTQFQVFSSMLKHFDIKYTIHVQPSIKDMIKILKKGNSVILLYEWYFLNKCGSHYVFIEDYKKGHFFAQNAECAQYSFILSDFFKHSKKKSQIYPILWEIKK